MKKKRASEQAPRDRRVSSVKKQMHKKISHIKKLKNKRKWRVYSKGGKNMGTYSSESAAKKRLQQIHYFKNMADDHDVSPEGLASEHFEKSLLQGLSAESIDKYERKLLLKRALLISKR